MRKETIKNMVGVRFSQSISDFFIIVREEGTMGRGRIRGMNTL